MNLKLFTKIAVIGLIMLVLMVSLGMISGVIGERSAYRYSAQQSIAQSWTGAQQFLGPVLVAPYREQHQRKVWDKEKEAYRQETYTVARTVHLLPEQLRIDGDIKTEQRSRGIYSVPVYGAELKISGLFSTRKLSELAKEASAQITWQQPYLAVAISDIRGVVSQPQLNWQGKTLEFVSGSGLDKLPGGMHAPLPQPALDAAERYAFEFSARLQGMERLEFSPAGKSTEVNLGSDWPHPSFIGRYLPAQREITDTAFTAQWRVSSFSSDMEQAVKTLLAGNPQVFAANTFGVSLINPVDIYQQTERAVKYAALFLLLTFVAFFLFEIMKSLRLHPMQYLLVGMALTLFYLLLISLSEHIAFPLAYTLATLACVGVIGVYLSAVLNSRGRALAFSGVLLLLYAMLFVILRSEDNALLMGSLLLFGVLALVMTATRRLDWYAVAERMGRQALPPKPTAAAEAS